MQNLQSWIENCDSRCRFHLRRRTLMMSPYCLSMFCYCCYFKTPTCALISILNLLLTCPLFFGEYFGSWLRWHPEMDIEAHAVSLKLICLIFLCCCHKIQKQNIFLFIMNYRRMMCMDSKVILFGHWLDTVYGNVLLKIIQFYHVITRKCPCFPEMRRRYVIITSWIHLMIWCHNEDVLWHKEVVSA